MIKHIWMRPCRQCALYEKLGYSTVKHERYPVKNGVVLVYEVMEKELNKASVKMN